MRVRVNVKDIADGERGNSLRCPVALALVRLTGKDWEVLTTVAYPTGSLDRHPLPLNVSSWIIRYDAGYEAQPIDFELVA